MFANCAGYSLEIDTNANRQYDSTGLGRIIRKGIPIELGLSVPFPATNANYLIPENLPEKAAAIGMGWKNGNNVHYICDAYADLESEVEITTETPECVAFTVRYKCWQFLGNSFISGITSSSSAGPVLA